jgi:hypothetical protein
MHEKVALRLVEDEACLIGESLLGFLAGALDNEIYDLQPTAFRCDANEVFLLGGCPKVEPLRFGFGVCSDAHDDLASILRTSATTLTICSAGARIAEIDERSFPFPTLRQRVCRVERPLR